MFAFEDTPSTPSPIDPEHPLWDVPEAQLSAFEKLVKEGAIQLVEEPEHIQRMKVGSTVTLFSELRGFEGMVDLASKISIDASRLKIPFGEYVVMHRGPVDRIDFRDEKAPHSKRNLVGRSERIHFVVLQKVQRAKKPHIAYFTRQEG